MGKWAEKISDKAQGKALTKPTKGALGSFVSPPPGTLSKNHALSSEARSRLRVVGNKIFDDCVTWYAEDGEIIEQMGEDDLEQALLEYLSKRDWYRRGVGT